MTSDPSRIDLWRRAEALFDEVADLPEGERAAWLDAHAAADTELRAEVEALLEAHDGTRELTLPRDALLDAALEVTAAVPAAEGQRLGNWLVGERIGRGGMGEVYRAHRADGAYDKDAALKIVRIGMDAPELVARFQVERQLLARLSHHNIARLLDGGVSPDGRPYLVMELIDGVPVDRFCRDGALPEPARLAIFVDICDAVSFAHRHLVVHRDLKPSNILVTPDARPVLLDFGVAKLVEDEAGQTVAPTVVHAFTPEYASPEQIAGRTVTTASDVYMLGRVLEEMLCAAAASASASEGKAEAEPEAKARPLSRDLALIVARARHEQPDRRYPSADALAADVRRYLGGLPIEARGDAWTYRAGRFVRRHRAAVAGACGIVIALAGGLASTLWQAQRARENYTAARQMARTLMFDVHDDLSRLPGTTAARRRLIDRTLSFLDDLAQRAHGDASLGLELVDGYLRTAALTGNPTGQNLGDTRAALAAYGRADALLQDLERPGAGRDVQERRYRLEYDLASLKFWNSEFEGARGHVAAAQAVAGRLAESDPAAAAYALDRASAGLLAADIEYWSGPLDRARTLFEAALAANEAAAARFPGDVALAASAAIARGRVGEALTWQGDVAAATAALRRAIRELEALSARDPANVTLRGQLTDMRVSLAQALETGKRYAEIETELLPERDRLRAANAADPNDVRAARTLAVVCGRLGDASRGEGHVPDARAHYEEVAAIQRRLAARDPDQFEPRFGVAAAVLRLGTLEEVTGHRAAAVERYEEAIRLAEALLREHAGDGTLLRNLALWSTYAVRAGAPLDAAQARERAREAARYWDLAHAAGSATKPDAALEDWLRAFIKSAG